MTDDTRPRLLTSGDIARMIGRRRSQVAYILESKGIEPIQRAALQRLYGIDAVERVRAELTAIEARRSRTPAPAT